MTVALSHSQLEMLARCGVQWQFRYVQKKVMRPSVPLLVGGAVDDAINADLGAKMARGSLLEVDEVKDVAENGLLKRWAKEGVELDADEKILGEKLAKGDAVDKAVRLADLHHRDPLGAMSMNPTKVQREFEFTVPDVDVVMRGRLDIQEGTDFVWDAKTAGKSPSAGTADASGQLTVYSLAVRAIDGVFPKVIGLKVMVDKKTPELVEQRTTRGPLDYAPLLARMAAAKQVIESGAFMPADPSAPATPCGWCGYRPICPHIRRPVSVAV